MMTSAVTTKQPLTLREDKWLSDRVRCPVFCLTVDVAHRESPHDSHLLDALEHHLRQHRRAMYFTKIDVANIELTNRLQDAGFHLVDTSVTLSLRCSDLGRGMLPSPSIQVRQPLPREHDDLLCIAESCFRFSRFHADPHIRNRVANHIKREWTTNCLRGERGDHVLVSVVDGRVTGFLSALTVEDSLPCAVIDLIGVDAARQRGGAGGALVHAFIEHYRDRCEQLQVGTQLANTGSLRLYQKFGFRISGASHVLHMHV